MRALILVACLTVFVITPVAAGHVILDGAPGIVACASYDYIYLDSNGHVWSLYNEWIRELWLDPPMPVEEIMIWEGRKVITVQNEFWQLADGGGWENRGLWPDFPAGIDDQALPSPKTPISPNPTFGPCRIAFRLDSIGPVSVQLIDASGRVIRHLLDGPHPAGEYQLEWDRLDDAGREVAAGMYFARIETNKEMRTAAVVTIR